jgi:hypothetical protein
MYDALRPRDAVLADSLFDNYFLVCESGRPRPDNVGGRDGVRGLGARKPIVRRSSKVRSLWSASRGVSEELPPTSTC